MLSIAFWLMIIGVPLMFVANVLLAIFGSRKHRMAHLLVIAGYTLLFALCWTVRLAVTSVSLLIANLIAAHFLTLAFPAWCAYRRKLAEAQRNRPPQYHGARCVRCEEPIKAGTEMCSHCGWAQPS